MVELQVEDDGFGFGVLIVGNRKKKDRRFSRMEGDWSTEGVSRQLTAIREVEPEFFSSLALMLQYTFHSVDVILGIYTTLFQPIFMSEKVVAHFHLDSWELVFVAFHAMRNSTKATVAISQWVEYIINFVDVHRWDEMIVVWRTVVQQPKKIYNIYIYMVPIHMNI
jgi:hypothetical protein